VGGISASADGAWMKQIARNLTAADDGFLVGVRHLILDRDPLYASTSPTTTSSDLIRRSTTNSSSPVPDLRRHTAACVAARDSVAF